MTYEVILVNRTGLTYQLRRFFRPFFFIIIVLASFFAGVRFGTDGVYLDAVQALQDAIGTKHVRPLNRTLDALAWIDASHSRKPNSTRFAMADSLIDMRERYTTDFSNLHRDLKAEFSAHEASLRTLLDDVLAPYVFNPLTRLDKTIASQVQQQTINNQITDSVNKSCGLVQPLLLSIIATEQNKPFRSIGAQDGN